LARKGKNLSQDQIKMRILAYLYNRGEAGANNYTIQQKANIPSQEGKRFREFLDELCMMKCIEKFEEETGGAARIKYRITQDGRKTVDAYRGTPFLPKIFGILLMVLLQ
jgi:hypothetical protein